MHYFALLLTPETTSAPDPEAGAAEMTAYQNFHAKAASAIRGGDALLPTSTGAQIAGGPDAPTVTDGPFAEGAEVAGGYYVFEAENLDEALALARDIPAAKHGAVEVWPMVAWNPPATPQHATSWLALLLEPPGQGTVPGTPEWDAMMPRHIAFGNAVGDHSLGGAPLHPESTATTVRVRDGEVILTDGPYIEGAEVARGFYLLSASDRDEAVKIASMIPASAVQLRQLAGISAI
jgi:hypothetical protein